MAEDLGISEFLAYCEEASHLKWNNKEKEACTKYGPQQTRNLLSAVRQSMPRIYRLLAGSDSSYVEDALADILSVPIPGSGKRKTKTSKKKKKKIVTPPPPPPPPPPPGPRYYQYSQDPSQSGSWIIKPGPDIGKLTFPKTEVFQFAYSRLAGSGNAFRKYLAWDFNLADKKHAPSTPKNVKVLRQHDNELEIEILGQDFELCIGGFSATTPLESRRIRP